MSQETSNQAVLTLMNKEQNPNTEHILKLKDEMLECWQQLPAEHQATMGLVFINTVMEGEWGAWLTEALKLSLQLEDITPERLFPITGIRREDLTQVHFTADEIAQLTDEDLQKVAQTMEKHYMNDVFWDDLRHIAGEVLEKKQQG
jgi:hypothetical protein